MTDSKGWIFAAGVLALAFSIYLWFSGSKQAAIFVGLWVPSLWILADLVEQSELPVS
jgi:glycerol-3-phosphate acyltransferase PlsY